MAVLGGVRFLMSEVPLYGRSALATDSTGLTTEGCLARKALSPRTLLQAYLQLDLAHKEAHPPLGPPQDHGVS